MQLGETAIQQQVLHTTAGSTGSCVPQQQQSLLQLVARMKRDENAATPQMILKAFAWLHLPGLRCCGSQSSQAGWVRWHLNLSLLAGKNN